MENPLRQSSLTHFHPIDADEQQECGWWMTRSLCKSSYVSLASPSSFARVLHIPTICSVDAKSRVHTLLLSHCARLSCCLLILHASAAREYASEPQLYKLMRHILHRHPIRLTQSHKACVQVKGLEPVVLLSPVEARYRPYIPVASNFEWNILFDLAHYPQPC
jgi:hypothetical protein